MVGREGSKKNINVIAVLEYVVLLTVHYDSDGIRWFTIRETLQSSTIITPCQASQLILYS